MLGKPTLDTTMLMVTTRIKEAFRHLEQDGFELITLRRQNEILKGHLRKFLGPLDPINPKEPLNTTLERRDKGAAQLDPFLKACQQWRESFEDKGVKNITQINLHV